MNEFVISEGCPLPVSTMTRRGAILGQPGAGKTETMTDIAEEALGQRLQVVILDYKGDFWGLRSSLDGKHEGFNIAIFGGDHGDLELHEESGSVLAQSIVENRYSAIVDLSNFETRASMKRFVTAFLKRFLFCKKALTTPVLLIIDEADQFAPERPYEGEQDMLGAVQSVVKLGRKRGIGVVLGSHAASHLSKTVLEICDYYIFMQMAGRNAIKAIEETVKRTASGDELAELRGGIGRLQQGEAFLFSPSWLRMLAKIQVRRRRTFDSSRTPEVGDEEMMDPTAIALPDIPALREQIAAAREKQENQDPSKLQARIVELERELAGRPTEEKVVEKIVEVPLFTAADLDRLDGIVHLWVGFIEGCGDKFDRLVGPGLDQLVLATESLRGYASRSLIAQPRAAVAQKALPAAQKTSSVAIKAPSVSQMSATVASEGPARLKAGAVRMLQQLARYGGELTKQQLSTLAEVNRGSGTFSDYLGSLRASGFIEDDQVSVRITAAGAIQIGEKIRREPMTSQDIVARFKPKLKAGAQRMLDLCVGAYPNSISKMQLADKAQVNRQSGTFSDYLGTLRKNGLITDTSHEVRASETLFLGGR